MIGLASDQNARARGLKLIFLIKDHRFQKGRKILL